MFRISALVVAFLSRECLAFETFNPMKVDFVNITPKTWSQNLTRYRTEEASQAVLFYSPGEAAKNYIDETFNPLSKKLINIVRMLAIDCDAHEKHCKSEDPTESWKKNPTVVSYPPLPRPIKVLEPLADTKTVMREVVSVIPQNHVTDLKVSTFDSFVDDPSTATVPKVIYFNEKENSPPSFHALANSMNDRISFAHVDVTQTGNDKIQHRVLGKKSKLPGLAIYKAKKVELFEGDISSAVDVFQWVNVHAETFVKGGGFSHEQAPSQPWLNESIPQMNKASHGAVCFKIPGLCAVYATPADSLTNEEIEMLESIIVETTSSNNVDAKFKFSWLDTTLDNKAAEALNVGSITEPHFLIINTNKRLRFTKPVPASKEAILGEIENLNAGNQRFTVIKGKKVPTFSNQKQAAHDEL